VSRDEFAERFRGRIGFDEFDDVDVCTDVVGQATYQGDNQSIQNNNNNNAGR